jgi:glycosyltransferase involved in cell wall biosynthesis
MSTVVLDVRVVNGSGGGPDKTLINSPRFLAPSGYRMLCAYLHPPGDPGFERLRDRARAAGTELISVPDRGPCDFRAVRELLACCRRENVAIWHGHDYKSDAIGLLLRRFWPMRLVSTVHGWGGESRKTALYHAIDRMCLPGYERVICVSEDLRRQCLRAGVPGPRCLLVENGIDLDAYAPSADAAEAKRRLGLRPDRPVIGAVGRLSAEKRFDVLIRAVDRLLARGSEVQLVIAGEGEEEARLRALIDELGRAGSIRLLGFQTDTIPLYRAMDVFALSSLREGLPNVLLEAMATGVPIVATRVGGVPRVIHHEENGLLVEPGDPAGLAESLARLLGDAPFRDSLRLVGRLTVEAHYSFETRMQKIRAIYDELLSRDRSKIRPAYIGAGA